MSTRLGKIIPRVEMERLAASAAMLQSGGAPSDASDLIQPTAQELCVLTIEVARDADLSLSEDDQNRLAKALEERLFAVMAPSAPRDMGSSGETSSDGAG
ncbi:MAG: hypothetical protein AAF590_09580 [Pseudomonadota bacterium]